MRTVGRYGTVPKCSLQMHALAPRHQIGQLIGAQEHTVVPATVARRRAGASHGAPGRVQVRGEHIEIHYAQPPAGPATCSTLSTAQNQSGIIVSAYEKSTASTGAAGFQVQHRLDHAHVRQPLCPLAAAQQRRTQIHDLHRFELREAVAEIPGCGRCRPSSTTWLRDGSSSRSISSLRPWSSRSRKAS